MSKKQTVLGAAAAIVVVAGGLLLAQGPVLGPWNYQNRFTKIKGFVATYLDLTQAQKTQAQQLFDSSRKAAEPIVAELKQGRDAMREAVKAGDEQKIDQLSQAQGVLAGRLIAIHTKAIAEFYQTLTPDQKVKAEKLQGQMRGMFLNHMGPHM